MGRERSSLPPSSLLPPPFSPNFVAGGNTISFSRLCFSVSFRLMSTAPNARLRAAMVGSRLPPLFRAIFPLSSFHSLPYLFLSIRPPFFLFSMLRPVHCLYLLSSVNAVSPFVTSCDSQGYRFFLFLLSPYQLPLLLLLLFLRGAIQTPVL